MISSFFHTILAFPCLKIFFFHFIVVVVAVVFFCCNSLFVGGWVLIGRR